MPEIGKHGSRISKAVAVCCTFKWYAAYTASRHEKHIAEHLWQRQIESFLPVYSSQRHWKDGSKVLLQLPLFPNYVFVHIDWSDRRRVLDIPGVYSMVGTKPEMAVLPNEVIEGLRNLKSTRVEPHPYLSVGERVRIKSGPFAGVEGIISRNKNNLKVIITLEQIMRSIALEIDSINVESLVIRTHN